ncbi:collectin-12-like [Montipora capricornis]|uniref:collectin-12-like n=1 Tax=Montipora capricornis TaxID=246305 RepID=UPI0035F108F7
MSEIVGGQDNLCFEMESKKATKCEANIKKQTTWEPSANSNKQFSRLLSFMFAVLGVCFIFTAAATFVLALSITFRSSSITTDPVTSQASSLSSPCEKGSLNNKVQDFTERLEFMQRELENLWMVINSTAEKNSNLARQDQQHMKKIQELEGLVNRTRQEANKANWKHYTALLSAGNQAKEEFHRVWTVVNTSQVVLSKQIRKLHDNLIQEDEYLKKTQNVTMKEIRWVWTVVNTSQVALSEKFKEVQENFTQQIMNISRTQGPRGLPGYNGTQGPPGESGPRGLPGYNGTQVPPGSSPTGADITLCNYQEKKSSGVNPGAYAAADVSVTEQSGKKIIGANCATNDAKVVLLSSTETGGTRTYRCDCTGTENTGDSKMYCTIHFWEC